MILSNLRIGSRLSLGFGAVITLTVAIVVLAWVQLQHSGATMAEQGALDQHALDAHEWMGKTRLNVARAVAIAKANGQTHVSDYFAPQIKQTSTEIGVLQKSLEQYLSEGEGKALMSTVAQNRSAYIKSRDSLFDLTKKLDFAGADAQLDSKVLPAADAYLSAMAEVEKFVANRSQANRENLLRDADRASTMLLVLLALCVGVGIVTATLITRSITVPLRRGVKAASVIAEGDLSQDIGHVSGDECGDMLRALERMQGALRAVVSQVRGASDHISSRSSEIADGNHDLSARTEEAAASLQQTASSMEQLTGTVRHSAESARQANELAGSAAEVAARGGVVVGQVVSTMDEINAASRKIGDIIGVIDSIAFQTNILALNAAVEAARAGEQGRGFAVVASEVRSLAQRSSTAAREIKTLIDASVSKVEGGARLVADAGHTMTEIVDSVQRVSEMIGAITNASTTQSDGIGQVNVSIGQLDRMTQQNAALVEQSAAAATSLHAQSEQLAEVVGRFRLGASLVPA